MISTNTLKVYNAFKGDYVLIRENYLKRAGFKAGLFFDVVVLDNEIILKLKPIEKTERFIK